MSEKEIIEGINKVLEIEKNTIHCSDGLYDFYRIIQGLLDLYNKEKEKNKLIKTYKGNLPENVKLICLCKDDFERNISTDYISKDKIRAKIKELEYSETICLREDTLVKAEIHSNIDILKELLEERN